MKRNVTKYNHGALEYMVRKMPGLDEMDFAEELEYPL